MAGVLCLGGKLFMPRLARAQSEVLPEGELAFYKRSQPMSGCVSDIGTSADNTIWRPWTTSTTFFRCHHTGEVATMDPRVIEHLNLVQKTLGG
jgi:hypothetical protein